ncbi:hypothetical protein DDZ18_12805 [Marinicauda salina]|uniref:Glycerophosphoryl diester phosphodiesterase membrane domain-containing protein n=1 Tax=Marinicauda salina TaxID=2135793 RepID=A0A2U2BRL2_9PROT|nr:hypothetical protein [Marinicauda salina]PWE16636.1 hypothetical protein DDZ18_12805 [Marinicauda salina]
MSEQNYDFGSATFFFFKTIGRRPGAALYIAFFQGLAYAGLFALIGWAMWPFFGELLQAAQAGREPDETVILSMLGQVFLAAGLATVLSIVILLMVQAAWLRLMTRDEVAGGIPFRFGGDELRLLGVNVIFIGLVFVGYLVGALLVALAIGLGAGVNAVAGGDVWGALVAGLIGFLGFVVVFVAAIVIMIKFAAAPAMTINERGFRLFEAWSASKRIVGWMFLSYLVLILVFFVGGIVIGLVQQFAVLGGVLSAAPGLMELSEKQIEDPAIVFEAVRDAMANPGVLIAIVITLVLQLAFQIIAEGLWHGVGAYVAVRHAGGDLAAAENTSAPAGSVGDAPSEG